MGNEANGHQLRIYTTTYPKSYEKSKKKEKFFHTHSI